MHTKRTLKYQRNAQILGQTIVALLIILALLIFCSCTAKRVVQKESLSQMVRIDYKETIHIEPFPVKLPQESKEIIVKDTVSHLETSVAESDARILPDGSLYHSLKNKDTSGTVNVPVKEKIITMDSIVYQTKEIPYPVEKELNWWQKFRMQIGGYAFFALLGIGIFYGIRLVRRMT